MSFDIVGIIFFLIICSSIFFAAKKGFFKSVTSFVKNIVSVILSILLCNPLSLLLINTSLSQRLILNLERKFYDKGGFYILVLSNNNKQEIINEIFDKFYITKLFYSYINRISDNLLQIGDNIYVSHLMSNVLVSFIMLLISFVVLFILIRPILSIINNIFKFLNNISLFKLIDKMLGILVGMFQGLLSIYFICVCISIIIPLNETIQNFFVETMKLDEDTFTLSKFFYQNNLILELISKLKK